MPADLNEALWCLIAFLVIAVCVGGAILAVIVAVPRDLFDARGSNNGPVDW